MGQVPTPLVPAVAPGALPAAAVQYDLAYQTSPIILQGGYVSNVQGGVALLTTFLPPPGDNGEPFAKFYVMPGGTLISQAIGMYPFANQQVAANATIEQPLAVSLLMVAPVNSTGGYRSKFSAFATLQQTLKQHNAQGGTYIVATPAFMYDYVLMTAMTDVTDDENKQKQILWQLDFVQPIVTQAAAAAAQNALYGNITSGTQLPNPPTVSGTQGASPATLTGVAAALAAFGASIPITPGTSTGQVGPQP